MVISKAEHVKIAGISAAVSNQWTSLTDTIDEKEHAMVEKFIKNTGVRGRYDAGRYQTTADFCYAAAKNLLEKKNISPDEVGIIVFVTQTADYISPSTACVIQSRLGIGKDCIAFDVNLGCSGFTYGINIVASLLNASTATKALLLAGDTSAKEKSMQRKEKTTHAANMLFGDSGTATLLIKDESCEPIFMISKTDGDGFRAIIQPYEGWRNPDLPSEDKRGSTMDDISVFNFAISEVPKILKETMDLNNRTSEDYDCLALHQANLFIMKQIAKRTGFPMKKTLVSLDRFGNTSAASVPVTLVDAYGDCMESRKIHVLSCGFGVGLSWSTIDYFVDTKDILPLTHTEEYFLDGYSE